MKHIEMILFWIVILNCLGLGISQFQVIMIINISMSEKFRYQLIIYFLKILYIGILQPFWVHIHYVL